MEHRFLFLRRIFLVALFSAAVFAFFSFAPAALAQDASLQDVGAAAEIETGRDIYQTIGLIIGIFFGILGIIFLVLAIYAGFLWMTSAGNADQVDKAKRILINATIGLVITLSAYAITSFIVNAIGRATGVDVGGTGGSTSIEPLSGSLGSGVIRDHYPERGAIDVPRNTKIFVTFKDQMFIESFIDGYDTAGTPTDTSDDITSLNLNTDNIQIYATADGSDAALASEEVAVSFTDDLKTFVFDPPVIGSPTENVNYTVALSEAIQNADGQTPLNLGGYEWTFTVGTELDVTPPEIVSVIPVAGGIYDRNIVVQIDFSEAVDPTASTGSTANGFENIQLLSAGSVVDGSYEISNGYRTVNFITTDVCGTNSCGETIYCLPPAAILDGTIYAATPGDEPPQAAGFPYDGIVDVVGNSLDGDGDYGQEDGEVGDDYAWQFRTTDEINLSAPELELVSPNVMAEDVDLDQDVVMTFGCAASASPDSCDSVLMSSSISPDNIAILSNPEHEMWYLLRSQNLNAEGQPPVDPTEALEKTAVTLSHGIFLESTDEQTYVYSMSVDIGIRNLYQNCYAPAEGPNALGGRCGTTPSQPYCCNGTPSSSMCTDF